MAFQAILRRSATRAVVPLAARFVRGRRYDNCWLDSVPAVQNGAVSRKFLPSTLASVRHHSSSSLKRPSSDESLLKVIESEIKCAEESGENEVPEVPEGFPFEIEDNPGQQTISLSREYQGESINVEVETSSLISGEEDDDGDANDDDTEKSNQASVPMVVRVSKKDGPCLEFGVTALPDEIVIDSLSVKDPEASDDQIAYEGPRFDDLDENLQKAFHKYLEIRGIKPSATNFLHDYMLNKDSREYLNWLKNLKKFVEA